uniref:Uncharacterized protein n=1 Tax=Macrostomum lignano TaxID=282301 RepID=A0A1I8FM74_9PLAT
MARDILLQAAAEQCCRGRDFIKDLPITKVENTLAWHVDSRDSGHVPGPWDVELKPSDMFETEDRAGHRVPHTDTV